MSGCKKCYQCYTWLGNASAIKGTDTIVWTSGGQTYFNKYADSLKSQGFVIDTFQFGWYQSNYPINSPICGKYSLTQLDATGDSCAETSLQ